jgi:hypothetical protein
MERVDGARRKERRGERECEGGREGGGKRERVRGREGRGGGERKRDRDGQWPQKPALHSGVGPITHGLSRQHRDRDLLV